MGGLNEFSKEKVEKIFEYIYAHFYDLNDLDALEELKDDLHELGAYTNMANTIKFIEEAIKRDMELIVKYILDEIKTIRCKEIYEQYLNAIRKGNIHIVKDFVDKFKSASIDVNLEDSEEYKYKPLILAVHFNRPDIVNLLNENEVDIAMCSKSVNLIDKAAYYGNKEMIDLLLSYNAEGLDEAFVNCSLYDNLTMTEYLLDRGANVHFSSMSFLDRRLVTIEEDIAFLCAVKSERYRMTKLLLKHGANVHAENDFAIKWARIINNERLIKLIEEYIA